MTKLLIEVLQKVSELPEERQDDAAHILLAMLENDALHYRLTDEDLREIDLAIAEADAGHFASDTEVEALLYRPWH
jgi:hypothetical protein